MKFEMRDPKTLRNHLLSIEIYGSTPDAEFIASVRERGVQVPLLIMPDGLTIGGHRRRQAAITVGLKEVPCWVIEEPLTDLEIARRVITDNEYRMKTTVLRAIEFQRLKEIEEKLAAVRQRAGKKTEVVSGKDTKDLAQNFAQGQEKREPVAADKAAKQVGMSRPTAEKAAKVVEVIQDAKAKGDTAKAEQLTTKLNKSVSGAYKEVAPPKPKANRKRTAAPKFDDRTIDKEIGVLTRLFDARTEIHGKGARHQACIDAMGDVVAAWDEWRGVAK